MELVKEAYVPPLSEPSQEEIRGVRREAWRAGIGVLGPFALAALLGLVIRLHGTYRATGDLTEVASMLSVRSAASPQQPWPGAPGSPNLRGQGELVAHIVEKEWRNISPKNLLWMESRKSGWLGFYLNRPCDAATDKEDKEDKRTLAFCHKTYQLLLRNAWLISAFNTILILIFPALFLAGFFRAAHEIHKFHDAVMAGLRPSFSRVIWYRRYLAVLRDQKDSFFWRRAGFAFLIAFGSMYLLSPLGIKASIVGEYLALNSMPGEASHPLLFTSFGKAPALTVGFAGFFLYSLTGFVRRFTTHDLNDRIFPPLFLRGITVALLALLLSSLDDQSVVSRAFIFAVGIFPQAGINAIAKMTQTAVNRISSEQGTGFAPIPEIDFWKETTLQEIGINDYNDLARADFEVLLLEIGMNPLLLLRACDRALLVHILGIPATQKLAAIPLFTASELVSYTRGPDACPHLEGEDSAAPAPSWKPLSLNSEEKAERERIVEDVLGVRDICLQIEQLTQDRNIRFILENRLKYRYL